MWPSYFMFREIFSRSQKKKKKLEKRGKKKDEKKKLNIQILKSFNLVKIHSETTFTVWAVCRYTCIEI